MAAEMSPADAVGALVPAITLLGFGAAAALVSRALNLSPIVGYLLAGILIGPGMLNLIHESGGTHLLAELGVVFLLFDIGMHVSLRELKESRGDLLGLAPVHLLLTGLISAGALYMLGISWPIAIAVGLSLGLSSTAVVARILTEREQNSCPIGRTATHVLIFQDIVAIFLMIFATSLGEGETAAGLAGLLSEYLLNGGAVPLAAGLLLAFVQALIAFGAAMLFSRYLLNPVFRTLAATRNDEAFTAFTLLLVLAAACATAMIGLSLTLGAFLAGLAVSGTPFRHQVQTEMGPFRGLLLSFFFISVG
ncbi:cation:proton antiporter, partial [Hyphomonas sp. UBA1923]